MTEHPPVRQRLLLTSFATWLPEQLSNASDDLLLALMEEGLPPSVQVLRQLPVDFEEAPRQAIAAIQTLQPDGLICFGMAAERDRLSLERQAIWEEETRQTSLPLEALCADLPFTDVSDDAGQFVCNRLYYVLLDHFAQHYPEKTALFVHVPVFTEANRQAILQDTQRLLQWFLLR